MDDSDVNRRRIREWIGRRVLSFLHWPKWRPIGEWISRCLTFLFHPTAPKYLAYGISVATTLLILWIWLGSPPFSFYCWNGVGSQPLGTILSALITVLATVSALVLSLMFITVQLSASAYTPRVIRIHFFSLHFLGIAFIFLGTILFLSWRLGQAQDWAQTPCPWAETAFTLFFTCLLFLIPYIWISLRLLQPKHLFGRLMWAITQNDFRKASRGGRKPREKLDEKLQPVIDIIRRAARNGQLRTVEEAFEALRFRLGKMIRRSKEEALSNRIAVTLADELFEIGRYANAQGYFETSVKTLKTLKSFLEMYITGATKRTSALIIYTKVKKLNRDFSLRYTKKKWPNEHETIEVLFAECRLLITQVLAK